MSNPTTLQELADSVAASANRQPVLNDYQAGYRQALLDTRATVLAMIASGRECIQTVHEYPKPVK